MHKRNKILFAFMFALIALIFISFFSIISGSVDLGLSGVIDGILGKTETEKIIIWELRIPRVFGAMLAGSALAAAGLILQCVTNNPLCAPNIVGINAGAGFSVILTLCFAPTLWFLLPISAFFGALLATLLILTITYSGKRDRSDATLVLSGVAVSSLLNAGISFFSIKYPDILSSYTAFSVGGFAGTQIKNIQIPFIIITISMIAAQLLAPQISLLCLGDEIASSLGVNVKKLRIVCIVIASLMCASAVSYAGLLGFVGLIVPHISRKSIGNDIRITLPFSALCGATLVTASDLAGRTLFSPSELPAGIIMAFIGAPFFLYLLISRRT